VTTAGAGLLAACVLGLAAAVAGAGLPRRARAWAVGAATGLMALGALVAALAVIIDDRAFTARLPSVLPLSGVTIALDPLGALFVVVAAVVAVPVAVYGVGYALHGPDGRAFHAVVPLFVLSLLLVPAAGSVTTLLVLWELMAVASTLLVLADHRRSPAARDAGQWYAVMTHLGLVAILIGLVVFAGHSGGESFAVLRARGPHLSSGVRSAVFLLALVGFGSKAGVVPLHVWLPKAHPEAPSHISALMSGVMVNLGVYGIVRVGWDLLGGGPRWWGVVVLAVGAVSALFGVLHALVSSDLKRLLAYSTTENVGLMLIGVGAAGLFASDGHRTLAAIAMAAALLHVLNHALFKALLFLGAGSVLTATGTRDLDRLGGLARSMPVTTATFAVGALAIAALPPLNGFVSEWLLLQSLVHSLPSTTATVAVAMPVAVAVVALTGGLAAATFVKALGTGFLARARSEEAEAAHDPTVAMQVAMVALAGGCVAAGVAPRVAAVPLERATAVLGPLTTAVAFRGSGSSLRLNGISGSMSPAAIAVGLVVAACVVLGMLRAVGSPRARRRAEAWGCGRTVQTARMEYTATSFAEPLQRVFDDVLRPDLDLDVSHASESRYHIDAVRYRHGIRDAVDTGIYQPLLRAVGGWGRWARRVQNGSIHRYLAYTLVAVLTVLVVAR